MKPRFEPVPPTKEDTKIWLGINLPLGRKAPWPLPSIAAHAADRRDADLMLAAQRAPGRRMFDCYGDDLIPQWLRGLPRGWVR